MPISNRRSRASGDDRPSLLLVESEEDLRRFWRDTLQEEGFDVSAVTDVGGGFALRKRIDYVFLGSGLKGEEGIRTLRALRERHPDLCVLSPANLGTVKELLEKGRGVRVDRIRLSLSIAERPEGVTRSASSVPERLIARSAAMERILEPLSGVMRTDTTILLLGETGTGKGLLARIIHANSLRKGRPFVEVGCTTLPESLAESELFGHVSGAFTDAKAPKMGLVEAASGGTLFLDEIGDLSLPLQGKLLRLLEERTIRRVGGTSDEKTDVRIIAATHQSLREMVKARQFREDLYYRLCVFPVTLPPLRERPEDILPLAREFVRRFARELGKPVARISPGAARILESHPWPGNVRELRNVIERGVLLSKTDELDSPHLAGIAEAPQSAATLPEVERRAIEEALREAGGNQSRAARTLGITRFTLRRRLRQFGIDPP